VGVAQFAQQVDGYHALPNCILEVDPSQGFNNYNYGSTGAAGVFATTLQLKIKTRNCVGVSAGSPLLVGYRAPFAFTEKRARGNSASSEETPQQTNDRHKQAEEQKRKLEQVKEKEEQAAAAKRRRTDKEGQVKEEEEQATSAKRKRTDKEGRSKRRRNRRHQRRGRELTRRGSRNQRRYSPENQSDAYGVIGQVKKCIRHNWDDRRPACH
jgi:hypothetical protein